MKHDCLYRAETYDIHERPQCSMYSVHMSAYPIAKRTPKGFRLECGKWVSATARKRFAYPTEAEAMEALKYRKASYVMYAKARYEQALAQYAVARNPGTPQKVVPIAVTHERPLTL